MKDFNIEQLAKKTPYKIPKNTFEEMQQNVLNKTVRKKEHHPKIFKINFSMVTSIAAALALIFGFTFLWKTNQTDITKPATEDTIAVNSTTNDQTNSVKNNANNNNYTETQKINSEPKQEVAQNETTIIAEQIMNSKNTNENYEQLLNSLTQEELAELSKNTSHDIYLDLYN